MNIKKPNTAQLVRAALMCAITTALTLIVLPVPITNGYLNLGDVGVYAAVGVVGGVWGVLAAAVGSMLSDFILAYAVYAPATFVIKGLAALFALVLLRRAKGFFRFVCLIACGVFIAAGYFLFEGVFVCDSFAAALINVPANLLQGVVGAALGYVVLRFTEKLHLDTK